MTFDIAQSLMFLPAHRLDRIDKAIGSRANGVILDLEDGVAPVDKFSARANVAAGIARLRAGNKLAIVRINAGDAAVEDLNAIGAAAPDAVMVPKVELAEQIAGLRSSTHWASSTRAIALIETPLGVIQAPQIAGLKDHLAAIAFGGEDYAAAMDVAPTADSLGQAAGLVALAARAYALPVFGVVGSIAEVRDEDAFSRSCRHAKTLGFTGALTIHPTQSALAELAFAPTEAEIQWARAICDAAANTKEGAFLDHQGRMVDRPVLIRAQRLLARAKQ